MHTNHPITNQDSTGQPVKLSTTGHSTPQHAVGWSPIDALRNVGHNQPTK